MFIETDPKYPQLLSGKERILDPATFRNSLGLGTMSLQNSNAISVTGGNATGLGIVQASQVQTTYVYSTYEFGYYGWFAAGVNAGSQSYNQNTLNSEGSLGLSPEYYFTDVYLGAKTFNYLDGSGNIVCTGTPTYSCEDYGTQEDCQANNSHGGCTWNAPYCPNWNSNPTECTNQGCTNDTSECYEGWDVGTCNGYEGCTFTPAMSACSTVGDSYSCNNYTNEMCNWVDASYGDCSSFDYDNCVGMSGHMGCSWGGGSPGNDCGMSFNNNQSGCEGAAGCIFTPSYDGSCSGSFTGNQMGCEGQMGCTWNYSMCADFDNAQGACEESIGCSWNDSGMMDGTGTCSGQYNTSCSGDYFQGNGLCSGTYGVVPDACSGMYETAPAYCGGDVYPSGGGTCSGNYYNGYCSGSPGNCLGTSSCATVSSCVSESGCSATAGMIGYLPLGYKGTTLCVKNMAANGSDAKILIHPSDTAGTLIDGSLTEITLNNFKDSTCFNFMEATKPCNTLTNETDCNTPGTCYWDGSSCSGSYTVRIWHEWAKNR